MSNTHLLDRAKTPAQWAATMAERGISISERTLRARANKLGACHKIGRAMLITPEQIDQIFGNGQLCLSNPIKEGIIGGYAGA